MTVASSVGAGLVEGYDVIGDVHGHADKVAALLEKMGYTEESGAWRHPLRRAVFVGDLVDNGPQQLATVKIVRDMQTAGSALVSMGNHEFNAIAWRRGWRKRSTKNQQQHQAFLDEAVDGSPIHDEVIEWFARLPLWLDLGDLRVIHACWDERSMAALSPHLTGHASLSEEGLHEAATKETPEFEAVEILLKGPEVLLPPGLSYMDNSGHPRNQARYRWWSDAPPTYRHRAHLPAGSLNLAGQPHPGFPDTELPPPLPVESYAGPPVIYGHYWQSGTLRLTSPNSVCVDYSAGKGGPLVAYRWSGETTLSDEHLIAMPTTGR